MSDKQEPPGIVTGTTGLVGSTLSGLGSLLAFASVLFGVVGLVISSLPFVFITLLSMTIMVPFVGNFDKGIELGEYGLRTKVFPIWRDTVRDFFNLLRNFYNPLICYWNAFNWWFFGLFREALFPTLGECGVGTMLANLGVLFLAVSNDLVRYFLTFEWINGNPLDFTEICDKWIIFFNSWIDLYTCSCFDIADLLVSLPAFYTYLPIPGIQYVSLVLPVINPFSAQWADPEYCCYWANTFNAIMAVVGELLRLLFAIFNAIFFPPPPDPFPRPDFRRAAQLMADGNRCFRRSLENVYQRAWDKFIPFPFNFTNWLCYMDTWFELLIVGASNALNIIINIDRVVQYPNDPYYEQVVRRDFEVWINLIGEPTMFDNYAIPRPPDSPQFIISTYNIDTNAQSLPDGSANPLFGRTRLTECYCIFVERLICDQTGSGFACFSTTFQQILQGFDACCFFNAAGTTITDIFAGAFELTIFISQGADSFFLFVDDMPYITLLKNNLVDAVRCALSIFTLIPEVGECIRDLLVSAVDWILCTADFLLKVIFGLGTLPYFLVELPGIPNFVTRMDEALDLFVATNDKLIGMTEGSFLYCLSLLLNLGFPIPPIPCSSCQVEIFPGVPSPTQIFKRDEQGRRIMTAPMDMVARIFGPSVFTKRVTPLLAYHNFTLNPFTLGNMIWANSRSVYEQDVIPLSSLAHVDSFVDYQKKEILGRWKHKEQCDALDKESERVKHDNFKLWVYKQKRGEWTDESCPPPNERTWNPKYEHNVEEARGLVPNNKRLTIAPTDSPLASCSDPTPPCFDLACFFRTLLQFLVHMLNFLGRFFNGLIQGKFETTPPTGDFRYFTGEACDVLGEDCFESDIVMAIILFVAPLQCLCEFINLIVPITPDQPRGDLCCAIQRVGELVACIVQVIINSIMALATGGENDYIYFRNGMFFEDVSTLFDITIELVDCLCTLLRGIFPFSFIPGFNEATNFDICCIPRALVVFIIEVVRLGLQIVISIATITVNPDSFCYFRLDNPQCSSSNPMGTLDEIGIVKQIDVVLATIFTTRDAQCDQFCGNDHGRGGIAPCVCQIVNSLLPARMDPGSPVSCDPTDLNCMFVDFCCPVVKFFIALNDLGMFLNRLIVSVWQSWAPKYPEFLANYLFCIEPRAFTPSVSGCVAEADCSFMHTPDCGCGTFTCGKLMPLIDILIDPHDGLFTTCVCEYVQLLDILLADYVGLGNWSADDGCFCGPRSGFLRHIGLLAKSIVNSIVNLIRRFPLPCFWKPCSGNQGLFTVEQSFIFSWLGPVADATCLAASSLGCFVNNLFFSNSVVSIRCLDEAQRMFGGAMRWAWEVVFTAFAFIEGFIRSLVDEKPTCLGGDCGFHDNSAEIGGTRIQGDALGSMLTKMLTFPIDALFGDSDVACSTICNPDAVFLFSIGSNDRCRCYELSPVTTLAGTDDRWVNVFNPMDQIVTEISEGTFFTLSFGCERESEVGTGDRYPICTPPECANQKICRPDQLPGCGRHPDTPFESLPEEAFFRRSIDGIALSLVRWLGCVIGNLGLPNFFFPIRQLMSIIWQIWGGVARFISAFLMFILSLFGVFTLNPFTIFGLGTIAIRLLRLTNAFFGIFKQPLIIPGNKRFEDANDRSNFYGPVNRESFHEFKARHATLVENNVTIFDAVTYMLYDYDVDDCFDDPIACICRNMDMEEHCTWSPNVGVKYSRDEPFSTSDLLTFVHEKFPGGTMCDHVIEDCDQVGLEWKNVPFAVKSEWVQCIDSRVRGERVHHVWSVFPMDFFYKDHAKVELLQNMYKSVTRSVRQYRLTKAMEEFGDDDPKAFSEHMRRREDEKRAFLTRLGDYDQSFFERRNATRHRLRDVHGYDVQSFGFEVLVKLDLISYKWYSGYYHHIAYRAGVLLDRGETAILPDPDIAFERLINSTKHLGGIIRKQSEGTVIGNVVEAVDHTRRLVSDIYNRGFWTVKDKIQEDHMEHAKRELLRDPAVIEREKKRKKKRDKFWHAWEHSPLKLAWDWYTGKSKLSKENDVQADERWFGPFRDHLNRTITYAQENDDAPWSFWNMRQRMQKAKKEVADNYMTPKWTPEIERNWAKIQAFFYKVHDKLWPNSLPRDIQERFIFGCNCVLADRMLDVTVNLVDYCVNEFMPNLDVQRHEKTRDALESFLNATSGYRKRGFYRRGYRDTFHHPEPEDPDAWIRPKKIMPKPKPRKRYHPGIYKRATQSATPGGFNLLDWLVCLVSEWFDSDLSQRMDEIIADIVAWFENDTVDVEDFPNVGFAYWATFPLRCEFPESLNCSLGSGLEYALWVTLVIFGIFFVVALFIPSLLLPYATIGGLLFIIIVPPAIAWHYSPQCWFMTPSFPLGGGVNLPLWPVPVAFPALPACALDEIIALLDKYITDCYDFILPDYMINGPVCPVDPNQMIDFANCKDVGVSDGIQNLLYLGFWTIGEDFTNFIVTIAGTCIGSLWPGLEQYLWDTLDGFTNASDTQMKRQRLCFYATLPTILFPLLVTFLVGLFLGLVIPAIVDLIRSGIDVFLASPAAISVPGGYGEQWYTLPNDYQYEKGVTLYGPDPPPISIDPGTYKPVPVPDPIQSRIGEPVVFTPAFGRISAAASYHLNHLFWPSLRNKKKEKKE